MLHFSLSPTGLGHALVLVLAGVLMQTVTNMYWRDKMTPTRIYKEHRNMVHPAGVMEHCLATATLYPSKSTGPGTSVAPE